MTERCQRAYSLGDDEPPLICGATVENGACTECGSMSLFAEASLPVDQPTLVDYLMASWDELDKTPESVVEWRGMLHEAIVAAQNLRETADRWLHANLGTGEHLVAGALVKVTNGSVWRSKWDTDQLRRDLLDTRRVDPVTGEIISESPLEKVLNVFPLGAPRIGGKGDKLGLKDYGLNVKDYCHEERKPAVTVIW